MKKPIRLTEQDLINIVKRIIKEQEFNNSATNKNINESFQDYLPIITGTIASVLGVRLFGKKILIGTFGLLMNSFVKASCKKYLKLLSELLVNQPEKLKIEYKKIKDYYQIVIDLRVISTEFARTDISKDSVGQLQSDNFPAKLKFYEDGTIEYYCNMGELVSENYGSDIYDEIVEFLTLHGEENSNLRGHGEEQIIFNILYKNLSGPDYSQQYEYLVSMDENLIDKISKEISQKLEIPKEIVKNVLQIVEPNENPPKEKPLWDYVNNVYKELIQYSNSIKESKRNKNGY